ncbi:MAG TPA: hypothetical protein VFR08_12615 [Candidatus Angelobacter sp.]|nr:hypothetical protein [Candidatus Angelobacter sp.]
MQLRGFLRLKALVLCVLVLGGALGAQQVTLTNVIPNSLSGESGRDSEPSIAVNPNNPLQISISTFTRDPGGSADAPLFLSIDGGATWTLSTPIVTGAATSSCVATLCDITLRFADASDFLYVSALAGDATTSTTTYRVQRIGSTFAVPASDLLRTRTGTGSSIPDQPYIEAHTALGGPGAGQDHISVPFNDLTVFPGMTATVDHTLNAVPPSPAGFSGAVVEARATTGQDSPPVRAAANHDGTVYAAFTGHRTGGNEVVVTRDDNWGASASPFQAITEAGSPGVRVATGLTQSLGSLGTQRVGSPLSIAVHPTDSQTVYVAYGEGSTTANFTLHVRNSTTGGTSWSGDLFTVTSAMNPSIAINTLGEVGLLYQQLTGSGTRYESHILISNDGSFSAASNTDILLANVPTDAGPGYGGSNPVGDYTGLMANGKTFYGVFSANNTPDTANFHANLSYPRNHNFATHTLTDLMGTAVSISVDPFFFSVTNTTASQDFYVRDWSDSPTSHDLGQEPSSNPVFYVNSDVWNRRDNTRGAFDAGTDRPDHQDPQEATVGHNFAFARVFRKAAASGGGNVDVQPTFFIADFGLGTAYVNAGPGAAPTLTFAPADTEKDLGDGQGFQWDLPVTHSDHVCMAAQIDSSNDHPAGTLLGHAPGWPTTDLMVINDNNKAQRNMGVWVPPAGGTDTNTRYFMVHNAASFVRDMNIVYEISPETARAVRVSTIGVIGGREKQTQLLREPKNGANIKVAAMQPGENRWVGVTMAAVGAPLGRFLPVRFTEVFNGHALNGLEIGPRTEKPEIAFREDLLSHASVFRRLAALFHLNDATQESQEAARLSHEKLSPQEYVKFVKANSTRVSHLAGELISIGHSGDPFGVAAAVMRFQNAASAGNPLSLAIAHAALLEKLDAFATMLDKAQGDIADILQNVAWQRSLFPHLGLPPVTVQRVTANSSDFIRAFEKNKAKAGDFPKLVDGLMPAYEEAAAKVGSAELKSLLAEVKANMGNPQKLQKAHRDYLLALQPLARL